MIDAMKTLAGIGLAAMTLGFTLVSVAKADAGVDLVVAVSGLDSSNVQLFGNPVVTYTYKYLKVQNGDDIKEIDASGSHAVSFGLAVGTSYELKIINQPYLSSQICSFDHPSGASGIVSSGDTTPITVNISCAYVDHKIGGAVTGFEPGPFRSLALESNAGEEITINSDGVFTFSNSYYWVGDSYSVWVRRDPSGQRCSISNWFGIIESADVTDIAVTCAPIEPNPRETICVSNSDEFQSALSEAAQNGVGTHIQLETGLYDGSFRFFGTQTDSLLIEGGYAPGCAARTSRPDGTILDGKNVRRPLEIRAEDNVTIRHLTIRDGFTRGHREVSGKHKPDFNGIGGGLRANVFGSGSLNIVSNVFQNNSANTDGGAANLNVSNGTLSIVNNLFWDNLACPRCPIQIEVTVGGTLVTASNSPSGGAIWLSVTNGRADLVQNTIVGNTANTGIGGGIRVSMNAASQESYSRLFNNLFFNNEVGVRNLVEGKDIWMQYDVGSDFSPEFPPLLLNNRFDDRYPEGIWTDFVFDPNLSINPGLRDFAGGDFQLSANSPLIDSGLMPSTVPHANASTTLTKSSGFNTLDAFHKSSALQQQLTLPIDIVLPETDLNGDPRISGESIDVGAFEFQQTVPAAPAVVTAERGNGQVKISWTASIETGGSVITGYIVTGDPSGSCTVDAGVTECTIGGLTNGTAYTFTVVATNEVGNSPPAVSDAVTPATVPNPPTDVTAVRGNEQATVSWVPTSDDGGSPITGYTITGDPSGSCTVDAGVTECTIGGLTNGTAYTFMVVATNEIGDGPASEASAEVIPSNVLFFDRFELLDAIR